MVEEKNLELIFSLEYFDLFVQISSITLNLDALIEVKAKTCQIQ